MDINTDNADTLAAALSFIAEVHAAVGDPEQTLTRAHVLARINAMTVTLTALTNRKDHAEIINQVTEFATDARK
jgi:hypothetical protein